MITWHLQWCIYYTSGKHLSKYGFVPSDYWKPQKWFTLPLVYILSVSPEDEWLVSMETVWRRNAQQAHTAHSSCCHRHAQNNGQLLSRLAVSLNIQYQHISCAFMIYLEGSLPNSFFERAIVGRHVSRLIQSTENGVTNFTMCGKSCLSIWKDKVSSEYIGGKWLALWCEAKASNWGTFELQNAHQQNSWQSSWSKTIKCDR